MILIIPSASHLIIHKGYEIRKTYQSMTPEEKLKIALRLYYSAKQLKAAALHHEHPNWTEKEIQKKVREIFLYART